MRGLRNRKRGKEETRLFFFPIGTEEEAQAAAETLAGKMPNPFNDAVKRLRGDWHASTMINNTCSVYLSLILPMRSPEILAEEAFDKWRELGLVNFSPDHKPR